MLRIWGRSDDIWPPPGCLLCWCPEEHGSDDGRERCQDWREREVQVVDWLGAWWLITNWLAGWFRRDKYLSSAMVEGDTAEAYIAQGQIEMRKMSNKGRSLSLLGWDQVRLSVLLARPRSLLSGQGCGAVWLWRSPGGQEQAGAPSYISCWAVWLFRCHYMFGHYQQSITDAEEALRINVDSVSARGCLGISTW